jgi:DNA-binding transcriptional LysR family regulator
MVMSDWLLDFKQLYPGIVLDVRFENRVDDLLREEVDIAIRVMSEPPQTLVARELGPVRYFACASRDFAAAHGLPKAVGELRSAPIVTSAVAGRQLRLVAYRGDASDEVTLEPTLISEHFPFLRQAIVRGLGIGIVPDYVVHDDVERGDVLVALADWRLSIFGTQMFMLYMPNRYQTRAAATFIDFILGRARGETRRRQAAGPAGADAAYTAGQ